MRSRNYPKRGTYPQRKLKAKLFFFIVTESFSWRTNKSMLSYTRGQTAIFSIIHASSNELIISNIKSCFGVAHKYSCVVAPRNGLRVYRVGHAKIKVSCMIDRTIFFRSMKNLNASCRNEKPFFFFFSRTVVIYSYRGKIRKSSTTLK